MTVAALAVYFPGGVVSFFKSKVYLIRYSYYLPGDAAFYIQLYSIDHNIDTTLSFYSVSHPDPFFLYIISTIDIYSQLSIINGAGIIGRLGPNYFGDIYGVWNVLVPITLITGVSIWAILGMWALFLFSLYVSISEIVTHQFLFSHDGASLIVVCILHGLSSSACTFRTRI